MSADIKQQPRVIEHHQELFDPNYIRQHPSEFSGHPLTVFDDSSFFTFNR